MSTIAAISTPPAPGGIGIVRLSGEDAIAIADRCFVAVSGKKLAEKKGYTAAYGEIRENGETKVISGTGNGPIDSFLNALRNSGVEDINVVDYSEHALSTGSNASAATYVELQMGDAVEYGVGVDPSITNSSIIAVVSAMNRILNKGE